MRRALFCLLGFAAVPGVALAQTFVGIPHGPNDPGTCGYMSSSGCEDKANFNTSSFDSSFGRWIYYAAQNQRILVNVKYDSNSDGTLDAWRWNPSKVAVDMTGTDAKSTVALGVVLANADPTYLRPVAGVAQINWQSYRRVMYFVFQGDPDFDSTAGRICLSFSNSENDANDWTPPIAAVFSTTGTTRGRPCTIANAEVLVEAVSGFHRTASEINLFALHGDISVLSAAVTSNPSGGLTETYFLKTTTSTPDVIQVQAMVTSNGMVTPTITGGDHDYFFRNLDATYDAAAGRVYLLRATPYPFDASRADIPCEPSACPPGLGLFPMRGQMYYMDVAGDVSKTTLGTSSWTLALDVGGDTGWSFGTGTCSNQARQLMSQVDLGVDLDSLTIHKLADGTLAKSGSDLLLFMGGWQNIDRKQSCVNAASAGGDAGGTWIDAELYELVSPVP
jgi:hypothetical protein